MGLDKTLEGFVYFILFYFYFCFCFHLMYRQGPIEGVFGYSFCFRRFALTVQLPRSIKTSEEMQDQCKTRGGVLLH